MSFRKWYVRGALLFIVTLLTAVGSFAQYRAGLKGVVLDPQGAIVAGAKVTVTANETGLTQESTTDNGGVYSVGRLAPGLYTVTVEKAGFKKRVINDLQIQPEQINSLDITMDLGQVTESVTVNGDQVPAIDTESGQVAGTVTTKQIQSLPAFGRDVFQLVQLTPGVFGDGSRDSSGNTNSQPGNQGPGGTGATGGIFQTENRPQVSAVGGRQDSNGVSLDGIGITSVSWGSAAIITPNQDSVKEVRVVASDYDSENGRFGYGQIQVISQNGTNQFHGSAFFKRDSAGLNAYNKWYGSFDNPQTPQRNNNQFNDWGGSIGGPIWKNKLFFFFSYETIRTKSTSTGQGWYETEALLKSAPAGSLAARYGAYPGEAPAATGINAQTCGSIGLIDAATATQLIADGVPGVQGANCAEIPGQGLDIGSPLNQTLYSLGSADPSQHPSVTDTKVGSPLYNKTFYLPGLGGNGLGTPGNLDGIADIANITTSGPNNVTNQQYNGRIDFNATSKDLLAYSIYYTPVSTVNYNGARPANLFHHDAINEAMTGLWTHTFSPTFLNEVRLNAAGWRWNELAGNPQIPLGLPQTAFIGDPNNGNQIGTACPGCNGPGGPAGSIFDQWTYGLKDVATKVFGSHTLKFGTEITKLHFVQDAPWSARPNWGFNNYWDFLNDAPSRESGVFNPQNGVPTDVRKDSRQTFFSLFVQDNYKIKPNLTLTGGLRYDYFGPVSFTRNQLSTVVLGQGADALTGLSMRIGGNLYNADRSDFGPQVGFAWSPTKAFSHEFNNRFVLRGGFGIGYTPVEQAILLNGWPNIPFTNNGTTLTLTSGPPTPLNPGGTSQIVYDFPSDPHQFAPYPANPYTIQTFGSNNLPVSGNAVSVTAFPSQLPTPYTMRYSLLGQYDIGHNWVATVGYNGSMARHMTRQYNINQTLGAQGLALNPFVNNIDYYAQDSNAHYNALLTEIQHRFASSFEFDAQYRYAKSMDNESGPYSVSNYVWNPKADYGPSDFDVTHAFKAWGIYTPHFFHGNDWKEKILGGWNISAIFNWHTGFPWSPTYWGGTCDVIYQGGACQNGSNGSLLPTEYLGGAHSGSSNDTFLGKGGNFPNGGSSYFTTPAVTPCALPFPQTCANQPLPPGIGRNSFRGPRYMDTDATITKSFGLPRIPGLGENAKFEFRANFYNLFNNLNLTSIDTGIPDSHFGQATNALGGRTIEMQARFSF